MEQKKFSDAIIELILSKKGKNIKILEMGKISSIADRFIICSGDSDLHVKAIADEIDKDLRDKGIKCYHKEGYDSLNWVILDYFDTVVHVFRESSRNYYNLEKLWGDAPFEIIEESYEDLETN